MAKFAGIKSVVLFTIIAIAGAGCAPVPAPEAMTVRAETASDVLVDRALLVENVRGGRPKDPMELPILGADEFSQALIDSLKSSRLFREVSTADTGDWRLKTMIISQETRGSWTNIEELMIRYEIVDAHSEKTLLTETIFTSNTMGVGDIFDGGKRRKVLIEKTARDNIAEFIKRLRVRLTTAPNLMT